jgi:hypothetical protein
VIYGLKVETPETLELKYKQSAYAGGNSRHVYNLAFDDVIGMAHLPFDSPQ